MTTISKLKQVLELLEAAGHGDENISTEHDQIYLLEPGLIEEDSELGKKLDELGAFCDDGDGWCMFA